MRGKSTRSAERGINVMQMRRRLVLSLFGMLAAGPLSFAYAAEDIEQAKISYLIAEVGRLKGAQFVRNGKEYGVAEAVEHMNLKRRMAGSRIRTAEEFIRYCATGSSVSGQPYLIRFADGRTVESAKFLRERLAAFPSH